MARRIALRLMAALLVVCGLNALAPGEPAVEELRGTFEVLGRRAASNVAAAQPPEPPSGTEARTVSFGASLIWHDGRNCARWRSEPYVPAPIELNDPMLSDTQIGREPNETGSSDRRKNTGLAVICDGQVLARLVRVDQRVLIVAAPNGTTYLILQRPLTAEEVRRVQAALGARKLLAGPPSGTMDAPTWAALATYAESRGAAYRFKAAALTENLLAGLGITD